MIENNLLGDRLNNYKNKKTSQESSPPQSPQESSEKSNLSIELVIKEFITIFFSIIGILTKSIIFGYSIKLIFNLHWNLLDIICVGYLFNYILLFITDLFHKEK